MRGAKKKAIECDLTPDMQERAKRVKARLGLSDKDAVASVKAFKRALEAARGEMSAEIDLSVFAIAYFGRTPQQTGNEPLRKRGTKGNDVLNDPAFELSISNLNVLEMSSTITDLINEFVSNKVSSALRTANSSASSANEPSENVFLACRCRSRGKR